MAEDDGTLLGINDRAQLADAGGAFAPEAAAARVFATGVACRATDQAAALIDDIESELHNSFNYEIESKQLGDMVLRRLEELDKVAYIRFASVYKSFQDLDEFYEELKNLE